MIGSESLKGKIRKIANSKNLRSQEVLQMFSLKDSWKDCQNLSIYLILSSKADFLYLQMITIYFKRTYNIAFTASKSVGK